MICTLSSHTPRNVRVRKIIPRRRQCDLGSVPRALLIVQTSVVRCQTCSKSDPAGSGLTSSSCASLFKKPAAKQHHLGHRCWRLQGGVRSIEIFEYRLLKPSKKPLSKQTPIFKLQRTSPDSRRPPALRLEAGRRYRTGAGTKLLRRATPCSPDSLLNHPAIPRLANMAAALDIISQRATRAGHRRRLETRRGSPGATA